MHNYPIGGYNKVIDKQKWRIAKLNIHITAVVV